MRIQHVEQVKQSESPHSEKRKSITTIFIQMIKKYGQKTIPAFVVAYLVLLFASYICLENAYSDWEDEQVALYQSMNIAHLTENITNHSGLEATPNVDEPKRTHSFFVWDVWIKIVKVQQSTQQMQHYVDTNYEWVQIAQEDYLTDTH